MYTILLYIYNKNIMYIALGLPIVLQSLKICIDPDCLLSCGVNFLNLNELSM